MATETDNRLTALKGQLTAGFGAASLARLHTELLAAKPEARDSLRTFYKAASALKARDDAFHARAQAENAGPDLLTNLRGTEDFAAMKAFQAAKEQLLDATGEQGDKIVQAVERRVMTPTR